MSPEKIEKIFSLMKSYGVEHFKAEELEIKMGVMDSPRQTLQTRDSQTLKPNIIETVKDAEHFVKKPIPPQQAVPTSELKIPHHINEVANLLRLNDEDLVDKLFPDYTKAPLKEAEGA